MKLFYAAGSPFVRKVMVQAHEIGIVDQIELVDGMTTPLDPNPDLARANPVGKIPALIPDNGPALGNSSLICEYLDGMGSGARGASGAGVIPANGAARWEALRLQAMADGLMDAAVNNRYETMMRPEALRWPEWSAGQLGKVDRSLDALEEVAGSFGDRVDIGTISAACACGYIDYRYGDRNWRASRPKLASWYESFAARPSMQATKPPEA